ncbi:MAG TPA: YciI family protein [Alphaproteobacteria bacterium]
MLYAILFVDDPAKRSVREAQMKSHLEFLARHNDVILAAGSLREDASGNPTGGLWIVDVPDRAVAEALYLADPFRTEGLRSSVEIRH